MGTAADASRRRAALALGFYVLATLLVAAPLPGHLLDTVPRAVRPDTWLNVWALAWTSEHLVTDPTGLFDANIFYPRRRTLAYSDHFIGQALLAAPFWWVTRNPALAYNVAWYLALVLTGWGGYLWVRRLLRGEVGEECDDPGSVEAGALVAGAVCLLVPGKRAAFGHLQAVSLQAVPLALLAAHGLMRRPGAGRAVALAAATGWAALCSWYTAAHVGLLLPAVGLAGLALTVGTERRWQVLGWGVAALGAAAVALTPVALPYLRVQGELGIERPVAELVATSLRPVDWVASWSWLHGTFMPAGSGAGGHFPGWAALVLGAAGLLVAIRQRRPWPLVYGALALAFAVLSLGPELRVGESAWRLPYGWLHAHVPGFTALRNPYRAAFVAALLSAPLVGLGTAGLAGAFRRRWQERVRPQAGGGRLSPTAILAVVLAGVHLLEAWPGPQQVVPLPETPAPAHRWLAARDDGGAALEWPLPRPPDLNARYQLGTVGLWTPLANGHSGLYPPEFLGLYDPDARFPSAGFLGRVKELYPVDWIIAHYDHADDGAARRRVASAVPDLETAWSDGATVVYRLSRGAAAGWLRRRYRRESLTPLLELAVPDPGSCTPRVALGEVGVDLSSIRRDARGFRLELDLPRQLPELVELDVWLASPGGSIPVALEARGVAGPPATAADGRASIRLNGWPVARGEVALARVDGSGGRLEAAVASRADGAADALRSLLDGADGGDWIGVAVAEDPTGDPLLVERLRLLADAAGGAVPAGPMEAVAGAYALVGRMGAAPGSAAEAAGAREATARPPGQSPGCLLGPLTDLRFVR